MGFVAAWAGLVGGWVDGWMNGRIIACIQWYGYTHVTEHTHTRTHKSPCPTHTNTNTTHDETREGRVSTPGQITSTPAHSGQAGLNSCSTSAGVCMVVMVASVSSSSSITCR